MGSGGGHRVAATQVMSPSTLEHWALLGELGVLPALVVLPGWSWLCR